MAIEILKLKPFSVAKMLGKVAVFLVFASLVGQFVRFLSGHGNLFGLIPLFNVDAEQNIPTLFSMLLLLSASALLGLIARLEYRQGERDAKKWAILAAWFLFMAVDEACSIHEMLIAPLRKLLGGQQLGIFYYAWVIPGIVVVSLFALFFWKFIRRLPPPTRRTLLLAAALFVGGALGIELIGGSYAESYGKNTFIYSLITTLEESLEMAGSIVFIYTLLKYIANKYQELKLRFDESTKNLSLEYSDSVRVR